MWAKASLDDQEMYSNSWLGLNITTHNPTVRDEQITDIYENKVARVLFHPRALYCHKQGAFCKKITFRMIFQKLGASKFDLQKMMKKLEEGMF